MTPWTLGLFIIGSPTKMCVSGFSLIPEKDLTKLIVECSTTNLEVLQFVIYGCAFFRSFMKVTYARHFVRLPCLTCLSKGCIFPNRCWIEFICVYGYLNKFCIL